jgi:23S rRNA pseudouridine1911/1915/1917 synthase
MIELTVTEAGGRLDAFLAEHLPEVSRSQAQRWIDEGAVIVNNKPVKSSYKTQAGDMIGITPPPLKSTALIPENIPLNIVFEDEDLLVVHKPKGMVVHPAPGALTGTLVHALLAHCKGRLSGIGGEERPGIVHRLDKDTSGLLVVAKNDVAHRNLQEQIQSRAAKRTYVALVWGSPNFEDALIEAPIDRHPNDRHKMAVSAPGDGREAATDVHVLERLGPMTLIECRLRTGRTHQIRVHCQFAGYPVVGDAVYGGLRKLDIETQGQALHACKLEFTHPRTGEQLVFEAPLPGYMRGIIAQYRRNHKD